MSEPIDRERWPGWHWSGGKKIEVGTPLACGIPFMSPRGSLCTDNPKGVECAECLKILDAPTNTLRLAGIGAALERIVEAGAIAEVCLCGTRKAKYHVSARGFDHWHDDLVQALSQVADDVEYDAARMDAVAAAGR